MKLEVAQHYHSIIFNMILGYSVVIGIGIILFWSPSSGLYWQVYICWLFSFLLAFFILVMYLIFLRELSLQIAIKNKENTQTNLSKKDRDVLFRNKLPTKK
jgi:hypothetical protein